MDRAAVVAMLDAMADDELRVVRRIAERVSRGRADYGELDLERDTRDWIEELLQELLDACVYAGAYVVRNG